MLAELSRREKAANIKPDHDVDIYMKVRIQQKDMRGNNTKSFSKFII